jgi:hypothetical protein
MRVFLLVMLPLTMIACAQGTEGLADDVDDPRVDARVTVDAPQGSIDARIVDAPVSTVDAPVSLPDASTGTDGGGLPGTCTTNADCSSMPGTCCLPVFNICVAGTPDPIFQCLPS